MKNPAIKWEKGLDYMDNSPRYTFEGRDPSYTLEDISVVIYIDRLGDYAYTSKDRGYYGNVSHLPSETSDTIGRYKYLKDAKRETEKLYAEYVARFRKR